MNPDRWQKVEELYHRALEIEPGARAGFLREACGDDNDLIREVESLLSLESNAANFIESPALEVAAQIAANSSDALIGKTIANYKIVGLLGRGGMGEVYLAEDMRLGRKLALKFLPSHLLDDTTHLRRFEQEARAASALNHPNILTIHEIGEVDGRRFIATEFIDGETLRQHLSSGQMKLGDALNIAIQLADALCAAHDAGIVHRDLKPENIMLRSRDSIVKVLDFGLAKLSVQRAAAIDPEAPTAALLETEPGVLMGTATYMSPEQARGEKLDGRSDIFSFGVVLYELVSGKQPFAAPSAAEVLSAILTHEPPPLERYTAGTPAEIERIVRKCLEKDLKRRYQTMRDLAIDLENIRRELERGQVTASTSEEAGRMSSAPVRRLSRLRGVFASQNAGVLVGIGALLMVALTYALFFRTANVTRQPEIRLLAVLPFKSLNQEAKEDYLGLGIASDIITRVSQSGELTVRPTSAVRKYVNQEMDALAAAREQQVDAVLESTFLHVGDQLRVNVNLLRVTDGKSLWTEKFDERFTDIFAIQDKVSQQVAERLRLKLSPTEQARLTKRYTSNPEAYNYYAKAIYHFNSIDDEVGLAVDLFKKAIELDPNYALAHAQLGYAYGRISADVEEDPVLIQQAKQEIDVAERLDPQLAEVHLARAFIVWTRHEGWQVEAAIRELRQAQQLDPNTGHLELSEYYGHIGLEDQAFKEKEVALRLDPNSDRIKGSYAEEYYNLGRVDEGMEAYKRLLNQDPDARYYLAKRMLKEAASLIERRVQENPGAPGPLGDRALLLALQGKQQEAEAVIQAIMKRAGGTRAYHHRAYRFARVYALGGKSEEALKWLQVAANEGYPCYPLFARDTFLDPISKNPAFLQFMTEMKTRWEGYQREFG